MLLQEPDAGGGRGARGGIAADVGQLARTDDGKVQGIYEEGVKHAGVALPGGCTDALQPIDASLGALIKVEVGKQLDIWLENGDNLERWESNALTASDRRVLLTKWVATAVDIVDNRPNYRFRLFEKTGGLMTADGTCDDRINLEGLTEPLAFMRNRGENEAGGGGAGGRGDESSSEESQGGEQDQDEESEGGDSEDEESEDEDEDSEDSEEVDEDSEEEDEDSSEEGSRKRV